MTEKNLLAKADQPAGALPDAGRILEGIAGTTVRCGVGRLEYHRH